MARTSKEWISVYHKLEILRLGEYVKKVIVQLSTGTQYKEFIDEDACWTNRDGYLTIYYGNDEVAEFRPDSWSWVELTTANEYQL